jgi:hypothetical protein
MYGQGYTHTNLFAMVSFTHFPQIQKSTRQRKKENMGIPTYEM